MSESNSFTDSDIKKVDPSKESVNSEKADVVYDAAFERRTMYVYDH